MSDISGARPDNRGGCLIPMLAIGAVVAVVIVIAFVLVVHKSPVLVWRTSATVTSGCPIDPGSVTLTLGMAGTEIQKLMGPPQTIEKHDDLERWSYEHSVHEQHEDRILGLLRIGGGSRNSSSSCQMTLLGGRLAYANQPGLPALLSRVLGRRVARLGLWSTDKGHVLDDDRPVFEQLSQIHPGRTTAAELDRILGPWREARARGALEYRVYASQDPTLPRMPPSPASELLVTPGMLPVEILLKDGIVVHSPNRPCTDEELLKEFDTAGSWPLH